MKNNKKYTIAISHEIRELLAEVLLNLDDFVINEKYKNRILIDSKVNTKNNKRNFKRNLINRTYLFINKIQLLIGLINFKIFINTDSDISFASGGFLITNKPYILYLEKSTQIYGYSSENYDNFFSKAMLKYFLRDKKLKKIFFLTKAAFDGMKNIPCFDREIVDLINKKGVVIYPPYKNVGESDLSRFSRVDEFKMVFIGSLFYEKGGRELLAMFNKINSKYHNVRLTIITKISNLKEKEKEIIKVNNNIELYDVRFTRKEIFEKFLNKSHVFVFPTYSDSFAAVINESIAAYLPIVTSDFYSIPERVIDGYNGFLFKSPFPNYDNNFVIDREHFSKKSEFPALLYKKEVVTKLNFVAEFLSEKIELLINNNELLCKMARNTKHIFENDLEPKKARKKINALFLAAIDKNSESSNLN